MLVTCNKPYVLKVDNVVWTPVEVLNGSDRYILSSGGLIEIMVDDERIFFFRNSVTPDFSLGRNEIKFQEGGAQGTVVGNYAVNNTYHQRRFPSSSVDYVQIAIYPSDGIESIENLSLDTNQGVASVGTTGPDWKIFVITNIDPTQYLSIHLGNVLLDFILPVNE